MSRFATLLRREWMQHHRGWLLLIGIPLVLALVAVFVPGSVQIEGAPPPPEVLVALVTVVGSAMMFTLAWLAMLLQAPGLARRDLQDRSVEFWMSLPVAPAASVAAMLVLHVLLMPLLALLAGFVLSQLVASVLVAQLGGGYLALPWAQLLPAAAAALLRVTVGVVLFTVWISPFVLLPMAASAWLKRWGVPVVLAVFGGGSLLLDKLYGIRWGLDAGKAVFDRAMLALINTEMAAGRGMRIDGHTDVLAAIDRLPAWALHDTLQALAHLADPVMLGVLAVSGACFWALVQRRRHAG